MKIFILIIFKHTAFYTKSLLIFALFHLYCGPIIQVFQLAKKYDEKLRNMGWTVVRIWESDIKKNVDECVQLVQETLFEAMMSNCDDFLCSSDP